MSHILFELLENSGFIRGHKLNREAIARAKRGDLVDIAIQSAEILPTSSISVSGSVFNHTASLSLSGGLSPCSNIECRRAKVNELAQFAALYSDKVITNNGLYTAVSRLQEEGIDDAKQAFEDELVLLLALRPLIESGHILPITPAQNTCFHCLDKSTLPPGDVAKFENAYKRFTKKFSDDEKVTLQWSKSEPVVIQIKGHEDLVEHGTTYRFLGNIGRLTRKQPKLAAKLKLHGQVVLSKSERKKWGIDVRFTHDFFDDIGFEMAVSQCLKTSVVTSRPLDIEILNDIVRSDELSRKKFNNSKTHDVPSAILSGNTCG